ncbi:prephenate dehydrogenase/arogenate dehydrogenase family protein [Halogeometricum sp. S1BR25-6]|uniref:Prephenate dehydrogenase/arogenate dehydrogenase family protein n=1 Tax=Halogeometricum salsisoli TaxID=2950536 RepID=A0ABU2GCV0_9EURY|nr:prephenate dehydrogenase/arogenate dehydrogenase family protein [Halogeometricum sp. S1BR25-6]MDS0298640.1 prephenate dehydrogenase/arogenate dehydrogenase family protein [Halogeometricum sp. S1BR25-6]
MEVLVVGAGEMGRWAGATLAPEFDVAYADRDPAAARAAAATTPDARPVALDGSETFDAVCLAVPISAAADAVADHAPRADRAVFDVTGVMAAPVAAMRESASERERLSLHPLFAAANAPGNVAAVRDAPGPVTDRVCDALAAAGNRVFETTPEEHDEAMETVQAGAHAAVLAYALAAEDVREEFATPVSEALSALAETVTGGNPRVYREIQESFPGADRVADAAAELAAADAETFERLYREANATNERASADADASDDGTEESDPP